MVLLIAVFFMMVLFSLIKDENLKIFLYLGSGILFFLIAAFRDSGIDKDYIGYIEYYNDVLQHSFIRVEPSFILITFIIDKLFDNYIFLFIVYAFLGVFLKFYAIKKLSSFQFFSVVIYFSNFYLLHEMTQIRIGVAAGFFLLCIDPILKRKLGLFLIFATLAFFFHYSAIVVFPLYFLNGNKKNLHFYAILIPIAYIIYFSRIDLFVLTSYIPIDLIQIKLISYSYWAEIDSSINIFNIIQVFRILLAYTFLWKWELITKTNIHGLLLIKIYFIALFIFVAFANIPAISSRISEFFMIVEIILIPLLFIIFKPKYLSFSLIILIGLFFLNFTLFYTKLLKV